MTVSGTTAFNMTVAQMITNARAILGIQDAEEPLQAHELQQGITALAMMLKAWQINAAFGWTEEEGQFTLTQGTASYTIGAGGSFTTVPLEILSARITRNSRDLPMSRMSRDEYFDMPIKTNQGYPTQFYYDRQRDGGSFYVWPTSDSGLGTIKFTYRRIVNDPGNGTNTLDVPPEWHEAISYGLAKRLLGYYPSVPQTTAAIVMEMAASAYAAAVDFDSAEGDSSISITPWGYDD